MASLLSRLPTPQGAHESSSPGVSVSANEPQNAVVGSNVGRAPPYGKRAGFVPRREEDFGDGGAFPEIHVAQYPKGLGKSGPKTTSKTLATTVDEKGRTTQDAIVKQGENRERTVHTGHDALKPKIHEKTEEVGFTWGVLRLWAPKQGMSILFYAFSFAGTCSA